MQRSAVCLWFWRVHQTLMLIRPDSLQWRSQSHGRGSLSLTTQHCSSLRYVWPVSLLSAPHTVLPVWIEWCQSCASICVWTDWSNIGCTSRVTQNWLLLWVSTIVVVQQWDSCWGGWSVHFFVLEICPNWSAVCNSCQSPSKYSYKSCLSVFLLKSFTISDASDAVTMFLWSPLCCSYSSLLAMWRGL